MNNSQDENEKLRPVVVIYEISGQDEADGFNGFNFLKPQNEEVLLLDLLSNFPSRLGKNWLWSIYDKSLDCWLDFSNPSSVIRLSGNIIRARLIQLAAPPKVSRQAVREQSKIELATTSRFSQAISHRYSPGQEKDRKQGPQRAPSPNLQIEREAEEKEWKGHGEAAKKMFGAGLRAVWKAGEVLASNVTMKEAIVGRTKVKVLREVAEGGFSKVFLARSPDGRQTYALKQMICQEQEAIQDAKQELDLLRRLNHPNIIQVLDAGISDHKQHPGAKDIMLLFPFYQQGTVWDQMVAAQESNGPWPLDEVQCLKLFHGTCQGVAEMHRIGFIHRDLKPLNILLADDGTPVLMDVGSATRSGKKITNRSEALLMEDEAAAKCSAPYRPPELTQVEVGVILDGAIDVWSLGCTLYCMAFGHSPFETPKEGLLKLGIMNARFHFPHGNQHKGKNFSTNFCQFISSLLKADPQSRPNIQQVVDQAYKLLSTGRRSGR